MSSNTKDGATQSYCTSQTGSTSSTLVSNLQQLASGVNSVLREAQLLPTEESLGQLETTDENFHRQAHSSVAPRVCITVIVRCLATCCLIYVLYSL